MPTPRVSPPLGKGFKWWYAWSESEHTLRAYRTKRSRERACKRGSGLVPVTYEEYQRLFSRQMIEQYGRPKCWQEPKGE